MKRLLIFYFLVFAIPSYADFVQFEIDPHSINSSSQKVQGNHLISDFSNVPGGKKLLITLAGTKGSPAAMRHLAHLAAQKGYYTIGLDYQNSVITTVCKDQIKNRSCFDHFREEVVFGLPRSEFVSVDEPNSIYIRILNLLINLKRQDPHKWSFVVDDENNIKWENIVIAGHSQGAGHAARLSKNFPFKKVILIAGPQDHFSDLQFAKWLNLPSKTDSGNIYCFLHRRDQFNSEQQIKACAILKAPKENIKIINDSCEDAHNCLIEQDKLQQLISLF